MNIRDQNGYLTESHIPLTDLPSLIEKQTFQTDHQQLLAKIKFANLYLQPQSPGRGDDKTQEYFRRLKTAGILGYQTLLDTSLQYELKGQYNNLVGVRMPNGLDYYLHVMTTEKRINQSLNALEKDDKRPLSTWLGICLFGSGTDQAITENGDSLPVNQIGGLLPEIPDQKIKQISIRHRISLYENYKIKHFTSFLNSFIASCQRGFGDAYLFTPADQYPLYLLPAFSAGLISKETYQYWTHQSSRRALAIHQLFAKRLEVPLQALPSSLEAVVPYLNAEIANNRMPRFDQACQMLGDQDYYWQSLLEDSDIRPNNWQQLKLLSYVRVTIEAAVDAERKGNLLTTIDDISEKPVLNSYSKIRRRLARHGIEIPGTLALYAPASIVAANTAENSYIYGYNRPTHQQFRAVMQAYRPDVKGSCQ